MRVNACIASSIHLLGNTHYSKVLMKNKMPSLRETLQWKRLEDKSGWERQSVLAQSLLFYFKSLSSITKEKYTSLPEQKVYFCCHYLLPPPSEFPCGLLTLFHHEKSNDPMIILPLYTCTILMRSSECFSLFKQQSHKSRQNVCSITKMCLMLSHCFRTS